MNGFGEITNERDDEEHVKSFCRHAVLGWKGLTYDKLSQLTLMKEVEDMDAEIPFSEDNAYFLIKESTIFDNWIAQKVSNLTFFR